MPAVPSTPLTPATSTPPPGQLSRWLRNPSGIEHRWLEHLVHDLAGLSHVFVRVTVTAVFLVAGYLAASEIVHARWARRGRWISIAPPAEPDPAGGLALLRMNDPLLT